MKEDLPVIHCKDWQKNTQITLRITNHPVYLSIMWHLLWQHFSHLQCALNVPIFYYLRHSIHACFNQTLWVSGILLTSILISIYWLPEQSSTLDSEWTVCGERLQQWTSPLSQFSKQPLSEQLLCGTEVLLNNFTKTPCPNNVHSLVMSERQGVFFGLKRSTVNYFKVHLLLPYFVLKMLSGCRQFSLRSRKHAAIMDWSPINFENLLQNNEHSNF